jgi:acyl carrier protein
VTREQLLGIVVVSFESTVSEAGVQRPAEIGESTALVGPDSVLDSMALVTLVLDVEQRVQEQLGVAVSLMNEQALSRRRSPFRTIGTLTDYILEISGAGSQAG